MNGYRVVYVEPGKPAVEKKIGTKLEDLQETVNECDDGMKNRFSGQLWQRSVPLWLPRRKSMG